VGMIEARGDVSSSACAGLAGILAVAQLMTPGDPENRAGRKSKLPMIGEPER